VEIIISPQRHISLKTFSQERYYALFLLYKSHAGAAAGAGGIINKRDQTLFMLGLRSIRTFSWAIYASNNGHKCTGSSEGKIDSYVSGYSQ
jgi:hypothetical protein